MQDTCFRYADSRQRLQPQSHIAKADNVTTLLPNLKDRFTALVGNLANLPRQHVDKARDMLKSLRGARSRSIRVQMARCAI